MNDLQKVLKKLKESQQSTQSSPQPAAGSAANPEIFSSKNYWCRYFDYSDKNNVIMQYDPSCKLYNIFGITGPTTTGSTPSQASSSAESTFSGSEESSTKPQVLDISKIKENTKTLLDKELKENKDFQKVDFIIDKSTKFISLVKIKIL